MKLTSGIDTEPDTAPVALTSERELLFKESGLAVKELRVKFSAKNAGVFKLIFPPCPSGAKAKISLSSKVIIESAVMLIFPPLPSPEAILVVMSLLPRS